MNTKTIEKIIYITNARIPTEKAHGLQIIKSCEAFSRLGIEVELIIPRRTNPIKESPFEYYGVEQKFRIVRTPSIDLYRMPIVPKKLAFYAQSISFAALAVLGLLFKRRSGTVFYSRDYITLFSLCLLGFRPVAEVHDYRAEQPKRSIKFIVKRSAGIVANSIGTKDLISDHYPSSRSKTIVAPNAVDLLFFDIPESRGEARRKIGMPENLDVAGYVGSFKIVGEKKGVEDLLGAFRKIQRPNTQLWIIGESPGVVANYRKHYKEESNIVFKEHIPYREVPIYLRALDILVIPLPKGRHAETTSPIKLFEYLAAGKAIIASDFPSLRLYLNESNALFFKPGDTRDLAEKIRRLLDEPNLARRIAQSAYREAGRYSWEARAKRIVQFIT